MAFLVNPVFKCVSAGIPDAKTEAYRALPAGI